MKDINYCNSSYLAFRYIHDDNKDYYDDKHHYNIAELKNRTGVKTSAEMDKFIAGEFAAIENKKLGIMLSGGMDSAILASYMPGRDAYTFRFLGGKFGGDELERAEKYAKQFNLNLHYVDIDWSIVEKYVDLCMESKHAPVHSIEPQILAAAEQAKRDGIELMIVGESADLIFGGMDQLIGKDWLFDDFVKRYNFIDYTEVLNEPVDMAYVYEKYRKGEHIDYLKFMDDIFSIESSSSYLNAFKVAGLDYFDPYAHMIMSQPLDMERIWSGDSKYLVRELFKMRYNYDAPNKIPMPRPVDEYFKDWEGPTRPEFKNNLDMNKFTGNQKWQLWCLERFLNKLQQE